MNNQINRREFLKGSVKGTVGFLAISVLPLGLVACNTEKIDTSAMANLGSVTELKKGPFPKKVPYKVTIQDAWVKQERDGFVYVNINKEDDSLLIMSPICTHLGCTAQTAEESKQENGIAFFCPCHGGEYDEYGINVGGPPPRPLDLHKSFLQDGNVYIPVLSVEERK